MDIQMSVQPHENMVLNSDEGDYIFGSQNQCSHTFGFFVGIIIGVIISYGISILFGSFKKNFYRLRKSNANQNQHSFSHKQKKEEFQNQLRMSQNLKDTLQIGLQTIQIQQQNTIKKSDINILKLKQIKKQLESSYPFDKFFLLRVPYLAHSVIASSMKIFENLGTVSCWSIKNYYNQTHNSEQEEAFDLSMNSILETEDGTSIEKDTVIINNEILTKNVQQILESIQDKSTFYINDCHSPNKYHQLGLEIYNSLRIQYENKSIAVLVTQNNKNQNKWIAVWTALADCYLVSKIKFKVKTAVSDNQKQPNNYTIAKKYYYEVKEILIEILVLIN